ncbi:DUF1761 domain-containing protein [Winogradskyella sp.]|uniref:DUF1761 domain-containing protein n=1 Tax=Winogradskyella sp. TaxID=1883156 RepID=UPI002608E8DD|nr:DUF1761 domain-containing protein [Winogradskyella sp.]
MENVKINVIAVVAAALSMFLIGGLWYSPKLFGNQWLKELGKDKSFLETGNMKLIFGGAFILALIMAFNLAGFVSGYESWTWGLIGGALAGLGWVAMSLGIIYLFERRSMKIFLINAGYIVVSFIVMGIILGLWK